ncbi:MAG: serine/threonine protein kinase [Nannocystaceae bacterium]|nr:serine/threonine protein kinase [Nannocystaceae bacterium]
MDARPRTASAAGRSGAAARYRELRMLGRGGQGEVTLCRDTWLGRDVARKRATGGNIDRFVREALLQARLDHPAVVPLFEATALEGPDPYFTMRHVSGVSLREVLARLREGDAQAHATWNRRRLLTEFVRAAEAIAFAHGRGIIHRDIKPDNLMLGEYGAVYVLDWGIAKSGDESPIAAAPVDPEGIDTGERLTREGASMGTPGYMAPEQFTDVAHVDARADIYALGAVLFEILTHERLHTGSFEVVLASTLEGIDARASVRAPAAEVPPELEAVCIRATTRDRDARYPDVRTMIADVERYLDGDRDLARRRELAQQCLQRANQQLRDGDDTASRTEAMREAMRALAFDPENLDARGLLARLLLEPPREVPTEVQASLQRLDAAQARRQAQVGVYAGLGWFGFLTSMALMGVRDGTAAIVLLAAMAATLVRAINHARDDRRAVHGIAVTVAFICIILAITTRWFGPFVLVPGVAAGVLSTFALHPGVQRRWLLVLGLSCFTLPYLAELAGLLPRSYEFTGDTWITRASLTSLPPIASATVLWIGSAAGVVIQVLSITTIRDSLAAAQRRLALQAWQLDQLVPRGQREVVT